jgi:hypothetical protein
MHVVHRQQFLIAIGEPLIASIGLAPGTMPRTAGVKRGGLSEEGKVPSANLVKALEKESVLKDTQKLKGAKGPIEVVIE